MWIPPQYIIQETEPRFCKINWRVFQIIKLYEYDIYYHKNCALQRVLNDL